MFCLILCALASFEVGHIMCRLETICDKRCLLPLVTNLLQPFVTNGSPLNLLVIVFLLRCKRLQKRFSEYLIKQEELLFATLSWRGAMPYNEGHDAQCIAPHHEQIPKTPTVTVRVGRQMRWYKATIRLS